MRSIQDIVQQEVLCCVSSLVTTLAQGYGQFDATANSYTRDLVGLADQAFELASPIPDYEEAAIQAGWSRGPNGMWSREFRNDEEPLKVKGCYYRTAEEACERDSLEPIDREVYEFHAVTSWLADKLTAAGEKVDHDFAGLCVWARTTTGQAIHADHVIKRIYAATHYDEPNHFGLTLVARGYALHYRDLLIGNFDTAAAAIAETDRLKALATGAEADAIRNAGR